MAEKSLEMVDKKMRVHRLQQMNLYVKDKILEQSLVKITKFFSRTDSFYSKFIDWKVIRKYDETAINFLLKVSFVS